MDKTILVGILIFVVVAAVAVVLVFNSINPKTSGLSNSVITDNQTIGNNATNITDSSNFPSSTLLTLIPFSSWDQSHSTSTPEPAPTPDPMDHIISLFDAYVKKIFAESGIPGAAVVIVKDDKVISLNCLGMRDIASGAPVTPNTLFQIASCTKAFTATNVAQLVDQGLLNFDDKITKYYPDPDEFKLYDDNVTSETTIRDVLIQRVGLPSNSGDEFSLFFNYTDLNYNLYKLRDIKNTSKFRTTFSYNNILYSLAGECAAKANHTTWSELIKKDLLEPLNMNTATSSYDDFINSTDRIHTYITIDNVLQERDPINPIDMPSGVIGSSISEIANWLAFQIRDDGTFDGKQIVSKAGLDETRTGQINMTGGQYGLGWIVGNGFITHSGSEYYSNSLVTIFTSENIGIACFTNEGTYGKAFNAAMQYKLYYLLNGDDVTDPWPASKEANVPEPPEPPTPPIVPPLPLSTYIGVYSNSLWGNINITDNNDNLVCYYGNNSEPFNLTHWNGNTFVENNFYMRFNFTNISNGTTHQLTTMELNDYTTAPPSSAVFKPYK